MLNTTTIPARNLQKSYKAIIEAVKTNKQPMVLTSKNKPQVAIVSLQDLERIQKSKAVAASLEILKLAEESREELKNLPADLRLKADEILYG